jgi:hypothetical protein
MSKHNPIGITVAQAKLTYAKGLNQEKIMSQNNKPMELSVEELDNIAGGALNIAAAQTKELIDVQANTLDADRGGVRSTNFQATDDFKAALFQINQTGQPGV